MSLPKVARDATRAIGVLLLLAAAWGCGSLEPTPPEPDRPKPVLRAPTPFLSVKGTDGAVQVTTVHIEKLPALGKRLDIQTVIARPHRDAGLIPDHEVALELRNGDLETVINGERRKRFPGEIWIVPSGTRVTLIVLGQVAVLRAVYLVPDVR